MANVSINDVLDVAGALMRLLLVRFPGEPVMGPPTRVAQEVLTQSQLLADGGAYVIDIGPTPSVPRKLTLTELETAMKEARVVPEDEHPFKRPATERKKDKEKKKVREARLEPIVWHPDVWEPTTRGILLRKHAKLAGCDKKTLLADLRLWWLGGQVTEALYGNYYCSGHIEAKATEEDQCRVFSENGEEYVIFAPQTSTPRGRRPADGYGVFQTTPKEWRRIISLAASHYLSDECKSIGGAVAVVHHELFSKRAGNKEPLRDEKGVIELKPRGQRPSYDQIYERLMRMKPASQIATARLGAANYANNLRPKLGRVQMATLGAGNDFEIDATKFNVHIVARKNAAYIIGKAVLYLVICRGTHLIVGVHLSLEESRWSEACLAILSIACDWQKLCEKYGIPYFEHEWPARGRLPTGGYFADRGEVFTNDSQVLCDGVGVMVTNAPPRMSSHKGIVESGFHTVDVPMQQNVPGYEPAKNVYARQPKHYEADAALALHTLFGVILRRVRMHNITPLAGRKRTEEEVWADVEWSPVELWHASEQKRMGIGPRMPVELMRRKLLPVDVGEIRQDGIYFRGAAWAADDIKEWFAFAAIKGGKSNEVVLQYDPGCIDTIIVVSPIDSRRSYVLKLAPWCEDLSGLTFNELQAHIYRVNSTRRKNDGRREELRASEYGDNKVVMEKSVAEAKQASAGMKTGTRTRLGEEERSRERRQWRKANHDLSKPVAPWEEPPLEEEDVEYVAPEGLETPEETLPQEDPASPASEPSASPSEHPEAPPEPAQSSTDFAVRPNLRAALRNLMSGNNDNL